MESPKCNAKRASISMERSRRLPVGLIKFEMEKVVKILKIFGQLTKKKVVERHT